MHQNRTLEVGASWHCWGNFQRFLWSFQNRQGHRPTLACPRIHRDTATGSTHRILFCKDTLLNVLILKHRLGFKPWLKMMLVVIDKIGDKTTTYIQTFSSCVAHWLLWKQSVAEFKLMVLLLILFCMLIGICSNLSNWIVFPITIIIWMILAAILHCCLSNILICFHCSSLQHNVNEIHSFKIVSCTLP